MINISPLVFNASGTLIEESVVTIDEQAGAYGSCSTMLNGETIIFGGWEYDEDAAEGFFGEDSSISIRRQISVVSDCTVKRLGNLPFDFESGTCGTFMIYSLPTILLCFDLNDSRKCRSFTRRNDGALGDINDFVFDSEFQMDQIIIPNSTYDHYLATIANYQGFPLILGGGRWTGVDSLMWNLGNNKLEMLNTMENPPRWVEYEGTDYPHSNKICQYAVVSTPSSVIYFGGFDLDERKGSDIVVEYQNLKWTQLGKLASPRHGHRSIKMEEKIYLFGGSGTTYIEIWKNTGDSTNSDYQGTLLDNSNDPKFWNQMNGVIIRINHAQCGI